MPHTARRNNRFSVILLCLSIDILLVYIFLHPQLFQPRQEADKLAPIAQLSIEISDEDLALLTAERNHVLAIGYADKRGETVKGTLSYNGESYPAEFRLGGSNIPHYQGNKWSMHVHLKHQQTLFGVRKFELIAPAVRGFFYERLFDDQLAQENILYVDYDYATVTLNHRDIGIMLLQKKSGPALLGRNEGVTAQPRAGGYGHHTHPNVTYHHLYNTKAINWRGYTLEVNNEDAPQAQEDVMRGLIRSFQMGTLPASDIFDAETMGRWLAVGELWGVWHGYSWGEMRFYLNPYTLKIEPISNEPDVQYQYDTNSGPLAGVVHNIGSTPVGALLEDKKIRAAFFNNLNRMSSKDYIRRMTTMLARREAAYRQLLTGEYPNEELPPSPLATLKERAAIFRKTPMTESNMYSDSYTIADHAVWPYLDKYFPQPHEYAKPQHFPVHVKAYKIIQDGHVHLEFDHALPVDLPGDGAARSSTMIISKILLQTSHGNELLNGPAYPVELSPGQPLTITSASLDRIKGPIHGTIYAQLAGQPIEIKPFISLDMVMPLRQPPLVMPELKDVLALHPYLHLKNETLELEPGTWQVTHPLIMPQGMSLVIPAGTHLQFATDSYIRMNGALRVNGTKEHPVYLSGIDGATWKGIAVLQAPKASRLNYSFVNDTTAPTENTWQMNAGVTFYEANVHITHSSFSPAASNHALNLVRSEYTIEDTVIGDERKNSAGKASGGLYE